VLLVDDDELCLDILEELLVEIFDVRRVESGEKALALASEMLPDVVLLDVNMSGANGYEVCQKIKSNPLLKHTKVVMVTALAFKEDRIKGISAGADDYVTKPFEMDYLFETVKYYAANKTGVAK